MTSRVLKATLFLLPLPRTLETMTFISPENRQNGEPSKTETSPDGPGYDEGKMISGFSTLLDSAEAGLPALALRAIESSGLTYTEFRNLALKIPNASRQNIGRFSDFLDGTATGGKAEGSLADLLEEKLEDLIATGIDLENIKQRMEDVKIPDYVLGPTVKAAIRKNPKAEGYITAVFGN